MPTSKELLQICSHAFCNTILSKTKDELNKSILRKLLFNYLLKPGELPIHKVNEGDFYIDYGPEKHFVQKIVKSNTISKLVLPTMLISSCASISLQEIKNISPIIINQILQSALNNIIATELNYFEDIMLYLYNESEQKCIENSNELINILNNDKFKYVFCRQITQKSHKLIKLKCIESGTYLAVSDIQGCIPIRQDLTIIRNDDPINRKIEWLFEQQIAMLIAKPKQSIKFVDQDYFDKMYSNKFKFLMDE